MYFNDIQRRVQLIGARTSVIVAGRRSGKTDGIAAPFVLRNMQRMAGSGGGIYVPTYKHGLTNTIPGMLSAWERWGYHEGMHYVIGRKAPKWFKEPILKPQDSEHVIRFHNGSIAYILSQDKAFSANSLTLSWLLADEARFINYEKFKNEALPALGGIRSYYGRHSCWNSMMILSDMPQSSKGSWFLKYRDQMDQKVIELIKASVYESWRLQDRRRSLIEQGKTPPPALISAIRSNDRALNQLRSVATLYVECSSVENLQLIGEDYIRRMKRDLTPLTFQCSVLCKRPGIVKDGFYSALRESSFYDASEFELASELTAQGIIGDSLADADVDTNAPICVAADYNANINWLVAGQPDYDSRRLRVIKSFFVKYERRLPELIDDFCRYYSGHNNKTVIFYYDSTALGNNYAVNDTDFRRVVVDRFERLGWYVIDVYIGQPMRHHEKHLLINQGLARRSGLVPMFNRTNNEDLIVAMQMARVENGRNGFKKDKSGEKVPESEENLLEHRTDGTDAFDTLYIGCEKFPQSVGFTLYPGIV